MNFLSEREAWNELRGRKNKQKRRNLQRTFEKWCPQGHRTSIRELVRWCASSEGQTKLQATPEGHFLEGVLPATLLLIAEYGIDYEPIVHAKPCDVEPISGQCYVNSWNLAHACNTKRKRKREVVYVEGFAFGPLVSPMLHGWNAPEMAATKALDWTFYTGCQWTRYLGVPFTVNEMCELCDVSSADAPIGFFPVFHQAHFANVETKLQRLLEQRKEQHA